MTDKSFMINQGKGFRLTFENGWSISVQFGACNYCDHYNAAIGVERNFDFWSSDTAETAAINPNGELIVVPWHESSDSVQPYQSINDVMKLMAWVADQ